MPQHIRFGKYPITFPNSYRRPAFDVAIRAWAEGYEAASDVPGYNKTTGAGYTVYWRWTNTATHRVLIAACGRTERSQ
jgi:hypothetical protein